MAEEEFDVIVVGLGPGGEDVAGRLAEAGLRVAGVEAGLVGGECPYWGCVPSKMMIRAADMIAETRRVPDMAGQATVSPDWSPVAKRIREEATDDWNDKVAADRFTGKGGHLVRGRARITGPGRVTVDGERVLRARRGIVLASGSQPVVPPIPGLADTPYWTNHQAIETETVPESLIVVGGGAIGAELAQVFARFGSAVTVIEAQDRILSMEEPEAGELIGRVFAAEGVDIRTRARAAEVSHDGSRFTLRTEGGDTVRGERLLVATGRRSDLAALGVAAAGLDESARFVPTDGRMRAAEGVWALGDIAGKGAFTHMSMYHANIVVNDILGEPVHEAEYHAVPRVSFTDPEVGAVGLTEAQARAKGLDVRTSVSPLETSSRGWIHRAEGLIKLVADGPVLVGATSVGPSGGEVLGMLTLAVHARIPVERLSQMIYAYPTFHRAVEDAVRRL
ncbi:pyridine nucleotide-disulfide oxidoreductase [Microtetraspora sp. NBRC 13810]|uniref:dihydrolipoyl dehydrogenase family protein n=1 Tax=Microtetraspora sp. NBRC 13810 TaxID=3030990 RepID=UPI0024A049BB|nr:NAD(P)/FAD-dependent oxidoreductase [Microtetraspora sp. NBRC 13810]GLW10861.1 pyridine nucleotide-disulfide oxidoreductase [Microtetraspora sp. NBRC 13810]